MESRIIASKMRCGASKQVIVPISFARPSTFEKSVETWGMWIFFRLDIIEKSEFETVGLALDGINYSTRDGIVVARDTAWRDQVIAACDSGWKDQFAFAIHGLEAEAKPQACCGLDGFQEVLVFHGVFNWVGCSE